MTTIAEKVLIMKVLFIFFITFLSALNCSYADVDDGAAKIVNGWFADHKLIYESNRCVSKTDTSLLYPSGQNYNGWEVHSEAYGEPEWRPVRDGYTMYIAHEIKEHGARFCPTIVFGDRQNNDKKVQNTVPVVKFYTKDEWIRKCFWLYNGVEQSGSGDYTNPVSAYNKSKDNSFYSIEKNIPMMNKGDIKCNLSTKQEREVVLAITESDEVEEDIKIDAENTKKIKIITSAKVQPVQIVAHRWEDKYNFKKPTDTTDNYQEVWRISPVVTAVRENAEMLFCQHGYVPVDGECIELCEESECRDSSGCQKVTKTLGRDAHGACVKCDGKSWDSGQMKCVDLTCTDNQIMHSGECKDKCPAGQGYNAHYTGGCIACLTGDRGGVGFDGRCKKCEYNEVYNAEVQSCVKLNCDLGQRALNGKCVSECPVGYGFRSATNNECVPCDNDIKSGVIPNGLCITCSEDEMFDVSAKGCVTAKKITKSEMKSCWNQTNFENCVNMK